jgi:hypothetical protein
MERTFDTPTPPRLELRLPAGHATIDAVTGLATTEVVLDGPEDALREATIAQRGDTVVIVLRDRKGIFSPRDRGVALRIRCPEGARVSARTKSMDVTATGLLAEVDDATASGDVAVDRVEGAVSLKSASGDLRLEQAGGEASFNTASGDVAIGRAGASLRANLVSGDVRVRDAAGDVSVNGVSGDVELECVTKGSVRVQSVSGDVEVGIRRGSRVHVDASTLSGDTRSELDLEDDSAGSGEGPLVELRVKTVSGDVAVVRAAEEVALP